jgi:hypothetical protein
MLQRKEEELIKRQTIEKRALPKRIRAERKARDMMFRESLRISIHHDPKVEEDKIKKVRTEKFLKFQLYIYVFVVPRTREETLHARTAAI